MKREIVLFLLASQFGLISVGAESEQACQDAYSEASSRSVRKAFAFAKDAVDDCDYPTVNKMEIFLRERLKLPAKDKNSEGELACGIHNIAKENLPQFMCPPAPEKMKLKTIGDIKKWYLEKPQLRAMVEYLHKHSSNNYLELAQRIEQVIESMR